MPQTVKVSFAKDEILAHSSNLLNGAKSEKLIEIGQYQIRTVINLADVTATEVKKKAAAMEAQKAADTFTAARFKEIENLVAEIKLLLDRDKKGDGNAGTKAVELVKKVSDDIDDSLPEFGQIIRKSVERQTGKLPSKAKSDSSGGFRGLKLIAKFENSGASGLKVKVEEPVKKWLAQKEPIMLKNVTDELQIKGTEVDGLEKVGSYYHLRCEKNPHDYIIGKVTGNTFTMLAIYELPNSGGKTLVAGNAIAGFG